MSEIYESVRSELLNKMTAVNLAVVAIEVTKSPLKRAKAVALFMTAMEELEKAKLPYVQVVLATTSTHRTHP